MKIGEFLYFAPGIVFADLDFREERFPDQYAQRIRVKGTGTGNSVLGNHLNLINVGRIMADRKAVSDGLALVFEGINRLSGAFDHRKFTIDGRLVGDIGEVIAELEYALTLHEVSQPRHDATTDEGREVQIKATFKESLTFRLVPDFYLGLKLLPNGEFEEIYNGPGHIIYDRYAHRKDIGHSLLSFPLAELRRLSNLVPDSDRVPLRGL